MCVGGGRLHPATSGKVLHRSQDTAEVILLVVRG
jgi:hypothetical protein